MSERQANPAMMAGDGKASQAAGPPGLAYFWGEDAYGLERAARDYALELASAAGDTLETWRANPDEEEGGPANGAGGVGGSAAGGGAAGKRRQRLLEQVEQHLATSPMFGGGTLVVVRQPGQLLREQAARQRLIGLLASVAPGNALCFVDLIASGGKGPAQAGLLRDAVGQAGGIVREFPALGRERMEGFIVRRAAELEVSLGPGAARLLAERVGAFVREGDVDRRRQSELANAELEKLALYRPGGTLSRDDVAELVSEAVPGSAWALQDALGARRVTDAARLAERLLDSGTPLPVLIAQLHRRLRELIVVRDQLAAGSKASELPRLLKLQPFRAQKLAEQARAWQPEQLDAALIGLLGLDLLSKGIAPDGSPRSMSDERTRLALTAWFSERVGPTYG